MQSLILDLLVSGYQESYRLIHQCCSHLLRWQVFTGILYSHRASHHLIFGSQVTRIAHVFSFRFRHQTSSVICSAIALLLSRNMGISIACLSSFRVHKFLQL